MKKYLSIILTGVILFSCSKKEISAPGAANQNIFYKDANVAVQNLQASQTASGIVSISFSTVYETNITRIELMSSASANTFCVIQGVDTDSDSQTHKLYSFQDTDVKGDMMYYLLRFEDDLGNWTYSNYYTVKIN